MPSPVPLLPLARTSSCRGTTSPACKALTAAGKQVCFISTCTKRHGLRRLYSGPSSSSQHCTPSWRGTSQLYLAPMPLRKKAACVAGNIIHSCVGDGKVGYPGPQGNSSTWFQPAQGLQGLQPRKMVHPLNPSQHQWQEQHTAGSDWFAPVAFLRALRDSSSGIFGFLKGHL